MLPTRLFPRWLMKPEPMPDPAPTPRRPIRSTGLPIFDDVLDEAGIEEPRLVMDLRDWSAECNRLAGLADVLGMGSPARDEPPARDAQRHAEAVRLLGKKLAAVTP